MEEKDSIQDQVSSLVQKILANEPLTDNIGGKGMKFGVSKDDLVDTFSRANFYSPVAPIVDLFKEFLYPLINQIASGNSSLGLTIEKLDVDIVKKNTIGADVIAELVGLPNTIKVNIPFIRAGIILDNNALCSSNLNLKVFGGKVYATVSVPFESDKTNGQKIVDLVRNILWHEVSMLDYNVTIGNVIFGNSEASTFRIASKISVQPPLGEGMALIKSYFNDKRPL